MSGVTRIEFREESDGTISYTFICEGNPLSQVNMAAFSMAKRGPTREEMNQYRIRGSFQTFYVGADGLLPPRTTGGPDA